MSKRSEGELTPVQAADVIKYYHDGENREYRAKGWKDKIKLGEAALHTTQRKHSILPDGEAPLTQQEVSEGTNYILSPPEPEKSEAYNTELERRVDTRGISYDEARREMDAEGW